MSSKDTIAVTQVSDDSEINITNREKLLKLLRAQLPENYRVVVVGIVRDGDTKDTLCCQGILGGETDLMPMAIEALGIRLADALEIQDMMDSDSGNSTIQ